MAAVQRAWVRALAADDPLAALAREAAALDEPDRGAALAASGDGFVIASLLVRKLRFEGVCRGDAAHEAWFERDPEGFAAAFRAYAAEVEPREFFPAAEAAAFSRWARGRGVGEASAS